MAGLVPWLSSTAEAMMEPESLFTEVTSATDPSEGDPAILSSIMAEVDFAQIEAIDIGQVTAASPAVLLLNLEAQLTVEVEFDAVRPRWPDGHIWRGRIVDGPPGEDGGHVSLVTRASMFAANIHVKDVGSYVIRPAGGLHAIRRMDDTLPIECGVIDFEPPLSAIVTGGSAAIGVGGSPCDDGTIVDLIVPYTSYARCQVGGQEEIEVEIDLVIEDLNAILVNSLWFDGVPAPLQMRLLYKWEINYDESELLDACSGIQDDLNLLIQRFGPLIEIHRIRNALRADIVSLIVRNRGSGANPTDQNCSDNITCFPGNCEPDCAQGVARIITVDTPAFESNGFSISRWGAIAPPAYTMTHEIGHNFGCRHDRFADCSGCATCPDYQAAPCCSACLPSLLQTSFGWHLTAPGPTYFRTVMAYPTGATPCLSPSFRLPHFSNPEVMYDGVPTGLDDGNCLISNALTIDATRTTISQLRTSHDSTNTTFMASRDYHLGQGEDDSIAAAISYDGQWIVFQSDAPNFLGEDNGQYVDDNDATDVFLFNRESGIILPVSTSHNNPSDTADAASYHPAISGNGRYIAIASEATNILTPLPADPGTADIYVFDRHARNWLKVTQAVASGNHGDDDSLYPSLSETGRFVAFESEATNLVAGYSGPPDRLDVYVRDRDLNGNGTFDEPGA